MAKGLFAEIRETGNMKKFAKKIYRRLFRNRLATAFIEIRPQNISRMFKLFSEYKKYRKLSGENFGSFVPILGENTATTNVDRHYFYQAVWAAKHIFNRRPAEHIDVGSQAIFVGLLTPFTTVKFVDIRPLDISIGNLENTRGSVLSLPFPNSSVKSLSCLHVTEHIGLGRYGDNLDPDGAKKACRELARILAPGGQLYFSVPIGKERVEFNAHRIFNAPTILKYFNDLKLVEFSAINDRGEFVENVPINSFSEAKFSCGLFHFTKQETIG